MSINHDRHGLHLTLHRAPDGGLTADPARLSPFQRACDWTSEAMGRPANIAVWAVLVLAWTCVFAFGGPHLASGSWMPAWFTSLGFNLPLNLLTTVCELFIGFLVGAASNRSERNLEATLGRIEQLDQSASQQASDNLKLLRQNTDLTEQVRELTQQVHQLIVAEAKPAPAKPAAAAKAAAAKPARAAVKQRKGPRS